MLTPDQINAIHRLHLVEKWPLRKIARHLKIGRRTLIKYIETPAPSPASNKRQLVTKGIIPQVTYDKMSALVIARQKK